MWCRETKWHTDLVNEYLQKLALFVIDFYKFCNQLDTMFSRCDSLKLVELFFKDSGDFKKISLQSL